MTRPLAILILVLAACGCAEGQSLVASTTASGYTVGSITTGNINTTGATLLVAGITSLTNGSQYVLTDNGATQNAWQALPLVGAGNAANCNTQIWYACNPQTSTSHSLTLSGGYLNGAKAMLTFAAFTGVSQLYAANGFVYNSATSVYPGSLTTPGGVQVLVTTGGGGSSSSCGVTLTGGTSGTAITTSTTNTYAGGMGWVLTTTATTFNPKWTFASGSLYCAASAVFIPAASSGGGATVNFLGSPTGTLSSGTLNISSGTTGYTSGGTLNVPAAGSVLSGVLTGYAGSSGSVGTYAYSGPAATVIFTAGGSPITTGTVSLAGSSAMTTSGGTAFTLVSGTQPTSGNLVSGYSLDWGGTTVSGTAIYLIGTQPLLGQVTSNAGTFSLTSTGGVTNYTPATDYWIGGGTNGVGLTRLRWTRSCCNSVPPAA